MQIVLIPGLMCDGWIWRQQIGALSRLHPVLIAHNDGCATLAAMARRIIDATRGPLCVIGHSMGSRVALEVFEQAPERIARIALLDSGVTAAASEECAGRLALVERASQFGMAAVVAQWLPPMLGETARRDAALIAGFSAMIERCDPESFANQQRALIDRPDRTTMLSRIACPALVLGGNEDSWAPPSVHTAMAAAMGNARFIAVEGAGHMLPVEAPGIVTDLLVAFLRQADAA